MRASLRASCGVVLLAAGVLSFGVSPAGAEPHEVMTDRCGGEVAFPSAYDARVGATGTIVLKRGRDGTSPTATFSRTTGDDGHVRWYCHDATGDTFDPGAWRVSFDGKALTACLFSTNLVDHPATPSPCLKTIVVPPSTFQGWTAARSRCGDRSTRLRARLGADRLLEIACLGR